MTPAPASFTLFPEQASTFAHGVDALCLFLLAISALFAGLIFTLIVIFGIKYRRRSPDEVPPPVRTRTWLELLWIAVPFGLSLVMFVWGARLYFDWARPPKNAIPIFVVAQQWMWKFQHPDGRREIDELHVPEGQPVRLIMTSQDVIHSFFVPAFRVKMDVLPGRYTSAWFQATRSGAFHLFCAEYCGTRHSGMIGRVVALAPAEYERWLASGGAGTSGGATMADAGGTLFRSLGCITCHRPKPGAAAPSLVGLFGNQVRLADGRSILADENYLRESIVRPSAKVVAGYGTIMPSFKGQVTEEQILELIEYIKSLAPQPGTEGLR